MSDWEANEDPKLLPCPFCGSPAMVTKTTNTDWYGNWMATCNAPEGFCSVDPYLYSGEKPEHRQAAIDLWNRRAPPK